MTNDELVDAYTRAVVEWDRAYREWSGTDVGTADSSVAFNAMRKRIVEADKLRVRLIERMDENKEIPF